MNAKPVPSEPSGGGTEDYILFEQQMPSGGSAGSSIAGSWQTWPLNIEIEDDGNNASIASSQITLEEGTYKFSGVGSTYRSGNLQLRLQNITDVNTIKNGTNAYNLLTDHPTVTSFVDGRFTIATTTVIELQYRCLASHALNGLGVANGWGTEIYSRLELWKENP
jgi:hypothetical protein